MNQTFQGIMPAVVTPLDAAERFAPGPFESLLETLYSAGVHGIYVCGQTGEGLLQSVEQRKYVAEVAMRCTPASKQVIVHVGAHRTADAVELARHAGRIGVAGVSSLPPMGPYSFDEIRAYYEAVAAASDVPVLVYYFPEVCPGIRTASQILDLCAIPNVAGLKFTDFDLFTMRRVVESGAVVFNGRDEVLVAGLLMGASGGIGTFYNLVPELFVEVYDRAARGDWAGARDIQDRINTLIRITLNFPVFPAVKEMLRWMGIECGECIKPRTSLSEEQRRELRRQIESCGVVFDRLLARA